MPDPLEIQGLISTVTDYLVALDQGTQEPWAGRLLSQTCDDPRMFLLSCCCPCVLAGQISAKQNRNCVASCICQCCCSSCHLCAFAVPDRRAVGKASLLEDVLVSSLCGGCCARVQLARELGVGFPDDATKLKEDAMNAANQLKKDITQEDEHVIANDKKKQAGQQEAPTPGQHEEAPTPAGGAPPAAHTMFR